MSVGNDKVAGGPLGLSIIAGVNVAEKIAAGWTPEQLFQGSEVGDYWDFADSSYLYQDTGKTTPVTTSADVVGCAVGIRGVVELQQATSSEKPIWTANSANTPARFGLQLSVANARRQMGATGIACVGTDSTLIAHGYQYGIDGEWSPGFCTLARFEDAVINNGLYLSTTAGTEQANLHDYSNSTFSSWTSGEGMLTVDRVVAARHNAGTVHFDVRSHNGTSERTQYNVQQASVARTGAPSWVRVGNSTSVTYEYDHMIHRLLIIDRHLTDNETALAMEWMTGGTWA